MSKKLFSRPLGDCMSPFGFQQKNLAPALAAMLPGFGAAVSGLFSGISNLFSSKSTNKSNERINRENNQFNAEQAQLNRDWEQKMWNMENQYNTPSAQRQRMEQAGINPFVDQSPVSAGGASGVPSGASAQAASPLAMQRPDLSGFGDVFKNLLSLKSVDANAASERADALMKYAKALPELTAAYGKEGAKQFGKLMFGVGPSELDKFDHLFNNYVDQSDAQTKQMQADAAYQDLKTTIYQQYGAELSKAQLANLQENTKLVSQNILESISRIDLNKSNISVNDAKIKDLVASAYNHMMQGSLARANAQTVNAVRDALKAQMVADAALKYSQASYYDESAKVQHNNWILGNFSVGEKSAEWDKNTKSREFMQSELGQDLNFALDALDYWFDKLSQAAGAGKNAAGILK